MRPQRIFPTRLPRRRWPVRATMMHEPAVDGGQQLTLALPESRVGVDGINDASATIGRGRRWRVAEQPSEGVGFQLQEAFQLGDRLGIRGAAALLPLPDGARRPANCSGDSTLRQAALMARGLKGVTECLALRSATVHARRMPDHLAKCRAHAGRLDSSSQTDRSSFMIPATALVTTTQEVRSSQSIQR
jgi:hypothetical protein